MTYKVSKTEPQRASDWRKYLFTYRSYTPIPFLLVMIVFARPTAVSLFIGLLMTLLGESVRFWGVSYAGSETRTTGAVGGTQLVTDGPYSHLRNPLYVGNIIMYVGVGIMSNALMPYLPLAALVYFIFQYSGIVALEEEYLAKTFPDWEEYKSRVPRFFPNVRGSSGGSGLKPDFARALRSERSSLLALGSISLILFAVYIFRGVA